MKSKRMLVFVISSIVLCACLFFVFRNETDTSHLSKVYEESVSPNKEYVSEKRILCIIQLKFIKMMIIQSMCM